jgi:ribonuclease HI
MNARNWEVLLALHPDREAVRIAIEGIKFGAKILYAGPLKGRTAANLKSADDHREAVSKDIDKEVKAGRIAGPFPCPPATPFVVSPIGTVPKKGTDEVRRIHHLSHPAGQSVNDYVDDVQLSYASFDVSNPFPVLQADHSLTTDVQTAVRMVQALGRNCLLAKIDVKAAFRCVAVHPSDRWLLGMKWCGSFYADLALPFGLKSSPAIWERYAALAEWMAHRNGAPHAIHYVDDFLVGGAPAPSQECAAAVESLIKLFERLGIPVNVAKLVLEGSPATIARFLGILIDTARMEARLDPERLEAIISTLQLWLNRSHCTDRDLQSLIGVLAFASKVVPAGRTFLRRMLATLAGAHNKKHIPLTKEFRADVRWWLEFARPWNGVALLPDSHWSSPGCPIPLQAPKLELFTDACNTGFGAVWGGKWLHGQWSPQQLAAAQRKNKLSMPYLEMLAVAIALSTWGHLLTAKRITIRSDSETSVAAINGGACRDERLMQLVRTVLFIAARQQFALRCEHVPGTSNTAADALSRGRVQEFKASFPKHDSGPTPITLPPTQIW